MMFRSLSKGTEHALTVTLPAETDTAQDSGSESLVAGVGVADAAQVTIPGQESSLRRGKGTGMGTGMGMSRDEKGDEVGMGMSRDEKGDEVGMGMSRDEKGDEVGMGMSRDEKGDDVGKDGEAAAAAARASGRRSLGEEHKSGSESGAEEGDATADGQLTAVLHKNDDAEKREGEAAGGGGGGRKQDAVTTPGTLSARLLSTSGFGFGVATSPIATMENLERLATSRVQVAHRASVRHELRSRTVPTPQELLELASQAPLEDESWRFTPAVWRDRGRKLPRGRNGNRINDVDASAIAMKPKGGFSTSLTTTAASHCQGSGHSRAHGQGSGRGGGNGSGRGKNESNRRPPPRAFAIASPS